METPPTERPSVLSDLLLRGPRALRSRLKFAWEQHLEPWLLGLSVRHVAGPRHFQLAEKDVLAICVVRNGALHVDSFIEHHLRLGVRHIVLLDNGSTDNSVALARGNPQVTVLRTRAPYQRYENTMKRYLARRFSNQRWNLCVDIDERFDFPGSDQLDVGQLVEYLRSQGYSALVAQMLDLFPDCALAELERYRSDPVSGVHVFYDLSNIRKKTYRWGEVPDPAIQMHWDGIRSTLFGSVGGLTKAALVYVERSRDLFSGWHHSRRARIADVSGVLLHYPFAGTFYEKVRDAVETGRYGNVTTGEYERYWSGLSRVPELRFRQPTSRCWDGLNSLVEQGFLVVSAEYRRWVEEQRQPSRPRGRSPEVPLG